MADNAFEMNATRPVTIEQKKSEPPKEESGAFPIERPEDIERKKSNTLAAREAARLDRQFFATIQKHEDIHGSIEEIEANESLSIGEEIPTERKSVGEKGRGEITRRTFEGDPPRIAYVKPQSGECAIRYHADTNTAEFVNRAWNPETSSFMEYTDAITDPETLMGQRYWSELFEDTKANVAAYYGIDQQDVPLNKNESSMKPGIGVGRSALREYGVSRINDLLRLDVVPRTVLRQDKENGDLLSIQEAVPFEADPNVPAAMMEVEHFADLLKHGPEYPGAKSLMRIACLDWLTKMNDRHLGNFLYQKETDSWKAIDNGYAMGLSQRATLKRPGAEDAHVDSPLDTLNSAPLEAVLGRQDWVLDDEARASMKEVRDSIGEYMSYRAEKKSFEGHETREAKAGSQAKFLSDLFRMVYGHEKIADKELGEFVKKLDVLITTGRPSDLRPGMDYFEYKQFLPKPEQAMDTVQA